MRRAPRERRAPPRNEAERRAGSGAAGFTLIEILIVLVILGLLVGLVVARGPMRSATLDLRATANEIAQGMRRARARAIATDHAVTVAVDVPGHRFIVDDGPPRALPAKLAVAASVVTGPDAPRGIATFRFLPDGSATGGHVSLGDGGQRIDIGVDWLTGRVRVAAAAP